MFHSLKVLFTILTTVKLSFTLEIFQDYKHDYSQQNL